ncbi:class I lanthipeptide [uncultured Aquimarina sp.]|uniref:class I lanthipeptide n=1 Tax=uncultured Aquimarina sp. TaxID=575652 RepID=UPI0026084EE7|nr:class I lanthipeptide [uncultured Aquimarina sp.]
MKNKQRNTITLKKLTIARINLDAMRKVKGGDCLPTEHEGNSHVVCQPTQHRF